MFLRELFEASKTAVFAFGRMNPPTIGHAKLVDVIKSQQGEPFLFLTHTQKPKTDPLSFAEKVFFAQKSFSGIAIGDNKVRTIKKEADEIVFTTLLTGCIRGKHYKMTFSLKIGGKTSKEKLTDSPHFLQCLLCYSWHHFHFWHAVKES